MPYSKFVLLPKWKVELLSFIARHLGILIHINGSPFGAYGSRNGESEDDEFAVD